MAAAVKHPEVTRNSTWSDHRLRLPVGVLSLAAWPKLHSCQNLAVECQRMDVNCRRRRMLTDAESDLDRLRCGDQW